ncbi:MAG: hypothetical protein IT384_18555 [Deltaproteobacteria bacterium]|nr:hypothetical protein [Deltaproteobacteria bacterium]
MSARAALALLIIPPLIVPLLLEHLERRLPHPVFDPAPREMLARERPELVLIGNSMLYSRIDPQRLERLTGQKVALLTTGGSASLLWYLQLKNLLIASGIKPRRVFIFFRDHYLTEPTFRTRGQYLETIERTSQAEEPELEEVLAKNRTFLEQVAVWVARVYPAKALAEDAAKRLENASARLAGVSVEEQPAFLSGMNDLFSVEKLRPASKADLERDAGDDSGVLDFATRLPRSFLPLIVDVAKRAQIPLVFVRVQRRPTPVGPPEQSPRLAKYIHDLREYLGQQGMSFYDFTGDPELSLALYGDGDHIAPGALAASTENFHRRLGELLR